MSAYVDSWLPLAKQSFNINMQALLQSLVKTIVGSVIGVTVTVLIFGWPTASHNLITLESTRKLSVSGFVWGATIGLGVSFVPILLASSRPRRLLYGGGFAILAGVAFAFAASYPTSSFQQVLELSEMGIWYVVAMTISGICTAGSIRVVYRRIQTILAFQIPSQFFTHLSWWKIKLLQVSSGLIPGAVLGGALSIVPGLFMLRVEDKFNDAPEMIAIYILPAIAGCIGAYVGLVAPLSEKSTDRLKQDFRVALVFGISVCLFLALSLFFVALPGGAAISPAKLLIAMIIILLFLGIPSAMLGLAIQTLSSMIMSQPLMHRFIEHRHRENHP